MRPRLSIRTATSTLVLALAALGPARPAAPSQLFVKGTASATYFLRHLPVTFTLGSYQAGGYTLERGLPDWSGRVRFKVTVQAAPLQSHAPYEPKREQIPSYIQDSLLAEPNIPVGTKPFKKLAEGLVHDAQYESDAAEDILTWIGENIVYDEASRDLDPAVVLEKKRGYCVGICNLALTMLRSVEIPSRAAHGLLLKPDGRDGDETRMDYQLHRLIEVYYPDTGWVLSDPQKTVNFVSTSFLYWKPVEPGANQSLFDVDGLQVLRSKEEGALAEDDFSAGQNPTPVYVRKNIDARYTATIEGRVLDAAGRPLTAGQVSIQSSAGTSRKPVRPDGSFSFIGLRSGEFTVRYDDAAIHMVVERVKIKDRELREVLITPATSGTGG